MNNPFLNQTISRATHRTEDLLFAFGNALKELGELNGEAVKYKRVYDACQGFLRMIELGKFESDFAQQSFDSEVSYFLNEELFDKLNDFAPEGYHFSAHEGDGSDFGFWAIPCEYCYGDCNLPEAEGCDEWQADGFAN